MSSTTKSSVIRRLEGRQCQWCEDGRLERDTYKGNRAAVCQSCETPAVQIW
ncbi:HVO_A0556 family zinc finger protein [Halomicrococcus sp. NG-SE-24]|uniref:HVO_A0556 family zinc finger protein n=1 Tax=unclassified Halomicrococcus TaxID=2614448 RepID=UPI003D96DCB0